MIKLFCKADEFQPVIKIGVRAFEIRFSKEPMKFPIYEGEGDDRHETGKYEESDLVNYMKEYVYGEDELSLEKVIAVRKKELEKYDQSSAVNSLTVNGKQMWFDKVTRTCIAYSMQTEKESGATETVLYDNDGTPYTLPIDTAIQMFGALELYAKACYNNTAKHKAALSELGTVEEALAYNIHEGYPEKLVFNTTTEE